MSYWIFKKWAGIFHIKGCSYQAPTDLPSHQDWSWSKIWSVYHMKFVKNLWLSNFQTCLCLNILSLVSYYVILNFWKVSRDIYIKGCSYQAPTDLPSHQDWSWLKIWSVYHMKFVKNLWLSNFQTCLCLNILSLVSCYVILKIWKVSRDI